MSGGNLPNKKTTAYQAMVSRFTQATGKSLSVLTIAHPETASGRYSPSELNKVYKIR
jgi:hypothetical protein